MEGIREGHAAAQALSSPAIAGPLSRTLVLQLCTLSQQDLQLWQVRAPPCSGTELAGPPELHCGVTMRLASRACCSRTGTPACSVRALLDDAAESPVARSVPSERADQ